MHKIGVLAGSPTDTMMGVAFLAQKGIRALPYAVSASLAEQQKYLAETEPVRQQIVEDILISAKADGVTGIMVYCNVLSTSVDIQTLRQKTELDIVTPMDVYQSLAKIYENVGILTASGSALGEIEKTMRRANPQIKCWGISTLDVVYATERGEDPIEIVRSMGLNELLAIMTDIWKTQAIILGCTNFPYFSKELKINGSCKIIDPSEEMLESLIASSSI